MSADTIMLLVVDAQDELALARDTAERERIARALVREARQLAEECTTREGAALRAVLRTCEAAWGSP